MARGLYITPSNKWIYCKTNIRAKICDDYYEFFKPKIIIQRNCVKQLFCAHYACDTDGTPTLALDLEPNKPPLVTDTMENTNDTKNTKKEM